MSNSTRYWAHKAMADLEWLEKNVAPRRPEVADAVAYRVEDLRKRLLKLMNAASDLESQSTEPEE